MKRIILFLIFIFITLSPVSTKATGPSHMSSIIQPISINSDGVILCKTKFEQNYMGAHRVMPIQYGWALVFPEGEIKEYLFYYFDTDSYKDETIIFKHYEYLESIFKRNIDWDAPPVSLLPLIEEHGFCSNNVHKYIVDQEMDLVTFLERYKLSAEDLVQKTLQNHRSIELWEQIRVLYAFDKVIFLQNHVGFLDERKIGAEFDFYFELYNDLLGYEVFDITGIIKISRD
ncbi:MAG TPA: hypothetical protein VFD78_06940 [Chitinophagaceae bacterium]|nr:hypothetical protein [Chitinophagaceae bacterium]